MLEGQYLLFAGLTDEALDHLRKITELEPKLWMPYMITASAYIDKGMYREAIAEARKEFELTGGNVSRSANTRWRNRAGATRREPRSKNF